MNFRTVFLVGKPDGNRLFFRAFFENIEGELEGESREENIGIRCVQNSIYVNFAIANFRDRALTVIPSIRWQFIRDMETQESVEASATTGVR